MIRHRPSGSRRQIELKVPICFPAGSNTGPLLKASVPEASTSITFGFQENGGGRFHKEAAPSFDHRGLATEDRRVPKEDGFGREERRKGICVAPSHTRGKAAFGREYLALNRGHCYLAAEWNGEAGGGEGNQ
jgi:hypothetical protein